MWYRRNRWRGRLLAEVAVMRSRFPGFKLWALGDGQLFWVGYLHPLASITFRVAVEYPTDFPYRAPSIWILAPELVPGTPHLYQDGSACIHSNAWDPNRGTAAATTTLAAAWLLAYVHWQRSGEAF
jgi:hypothetical protein